MKCPQCKSENLATEKQLNGNTRCLDCGFEAPTQKFTPPVSDALYDLCKTIDFYAVHTPVCDARIRLKPTRCNCGLQDARDRLKIFEGYNG